MSASAEPLLAGFNHPSCLIYGIGNIGRQDDGLGWAFIDWLEGSALCQQAELVRHYQLQLEDVDLISHNSKVFFVDATRARDVEIFRLESVTPEMDFSFTSHAISIPSILAACELCFGHLPEVRLLTIRGYEWELQEGLSPGAKQNLETVIKCLGALIPENMESKNERV